MKTAIGRVGLAGALLLGALVSLTAAAPPASAVAVTHQVLDFSAPSSAGGWLAQNTRTASPSLPQLQSTDSLDVLGILNVFGVDASGTLFDLVADGPGNTWHSSNLTTTASGPTLGGTVSAISVWPGQVAVFGIGTGAAAGHLIEYSTSGADGRVWLVRDLSADTGRASLVGTPSVVLGPGSIIRVYATNASGDVLEFLPPTRAGWTATDLTTQYKLPAMAGSVGVTVSAVTIAVVCIFGRTAAGDLVEITVNPAASPPVGFSDLSTTIGAGTIASDPSATSVAAWVVVAAARPDGSLVILGSPLPWFRVIDHPKITNFSALTGTAFEGADTPAIIAIPSGALVATRSAAGHLLGHVAYGLAGFTMGTGVDLTAQTGTAQTGIETAPSAALVGGTTIRIDAGSTLGTAGTRDTLAVGASLTVGQSLVSPDGAYQAILQTDGNFVVYAVGGRPRWSTMTLGPPAVRVTIGPAGNMRVLDAHGNLLRLYGTGSGPSTVLAMRTDGSLALVLPTGPPVWATASSMTDRIVATVKSQLGVSENPVGSNCNPYTAYFGRGSSAGCAPGNRAEAWCSDFANWAWLQSGAAVSGLTGWSYTFVDYGMARGTFKQGALNNPKPGDAVVWGDMSSHYGTHVGIVVNVLLGYIDVVSGNDGTQVGESGWINALTSTIDGYSIVGYTSPVPATLLAGVRAPATTNLVTQAAINTQDGGR